MKKILMILLSLLLVACSNPTNNVKDKTFLREYGLENIPVEIEKLSYGKLSGSTNLNGVVLVVRSDCPYCHDMLKVFEEVVNSNHKTEELKNIYFLDSNEMELEEKEEMTEKYSVSSVPTIMVFEDGNLTITEIGVLPNERMKEVIKK